MNWNSTISAVFENTEEDEIGYYTPIKHRLAIFCEENDPCRGTRDVEDGMLMVYMYNLSDYKGDLFNSIYFGSIHKSIGEMHTWTLKGPEGLSKEGLELYDYLITTGKMTENENTSAGHSN